jgi:hypothetical protein
MLTRTFRASKVPEVFLLFWIVKLLTTGLGEAGADYLGTVSIALAAVIGIGGFFVVMWLQLRADRYHPVRYSPTDRTSSSARRTPSTPGSTFSFCADCSPGGDAARGRCRCTRS